MAINQRVFWHNVKKLRESKELSQQQIADRAGINVKAYNNRERCMAAGLPMDIAEAVAKVLDTSVEELAQGEEPNEPLINPRVQSFWQAVRAKRQSLEITQHEMAIRLNMSSNNYSMKESGKASKLSPNLMERVANALGCEVDELMENQEEQNIEQKQLNYEIISNNSKYNIDHLPEAIQKFLSDKENERFIVNMVVESLMNKK